jgi:uncharacterized protein (TIGR02145 family)
MEKYLIIIQKYIKKLDTEAEKFIRSGKFIKCLILIVVIGIVIIATAVKDIISTKKYGSISYGSRTYKTVVIGTQTWMAENLNYEASGSRCYDNEFRNCYKYGRLYTWETAKKVCPEGWHLPTNSDWDKLVSSKPAGKYLKATSDWDENGNGVDKFGFAALPGGIGTLDNKFFNIGYSGYWWSATEFGVDDANARYMYSNDESVGWRNFDKIGLFSVRCVKDKS